MTKFEKFKSGLTTIFGNNDKTVIGAVVTIAYSDGTFDSRAMLTDAEEDFQLNLVGDLISHSSRAVLNCFGTLDTALEKLGRVIA